MPIRRSLAALFLASFVALAGCASDGGDAPESEEMPDSGEGLGDLEDQLEVPEPDVDDVPDVVAEVNGEEIEREEFIAAYEGQLQQAFMMQQGQEVDQDELKQQVAQQLANNRLLVQTAAEAGITATDEDADSELEGLAEANGMETVDELLDALQAQGLSEQDVREEVARQYQIDTYVDGEISTVEPTDDELKEEYDALVEQLESQGASDDQEMPPFEEVRDQLLDDSMREQENQAISDLLEDLQKDADIVIHL